MLRRAVTVLVLVAVALPATPSVSGAQSVGSLKAEAARVEQELEARGRALSLVTERYNEARLQAEERSAALADARRRLDLAEGALADGRQRFEEHAVALYKGTAAPDPTGIFSVRNASELSTRTKYASIVTTRSSDVLDELRSLKVDRANEAEAVERAHDEAERAAHDVANERKAAAAAMAEQKVLLGKLQGEIGRLVAEEQRRRAAEEERRARERAARGRAVVPDEPTGPPPPPHPSAAVAVATARAQLGKPYLWAATGPDAFDCSGLTMFAWQAAGVRLPHSSRAQYSSLPHVRMDSLAPGDLLFYGSPIHHVGIYAGEGQMINAPETGQFVRVSSIYRGDFAGAARPR